MNASLEIFVGMPLFFIDNGFKHKNKHTCYFSDYIHEEVIEKISLIYKEYFDINFNTKKYDFYLEVKCKNHTICFIQDTFKYLKHKSYDISFNTFKPFHDMQEYRFFIDEDFLVTQNVFSKRKFAFNHIENEIG